MTKEQMQTVIDRLTSGTPIFVRQGDNAYPAKPRLFEEECAQGDTPGLVLYLEIDHKRLNEHRNFPDMGERPLPI